MRGGLAFLEGRLFFIPKFHRAEHAGEGAYLFALLPFGFRGKGAVDGVGSNLFNHFGLFGLFGGVLPEVGAGNLETVEEEAGAA